MRLYSVSGDTIFKSSHINIRQALEEAVSESIDLKEVNLRKANLRGAQLDMAKMRNACFWGADLTDADMGYGDFQGCDFRATLLKDTCFSDADCSNSHFHGAYFSKTLFDGTDLSGVNFSCPSLFSCDLTLVKTLENSVYSHQGEVECALTKAPVIIQGLCVNGRYQSIVIMDQDMIIGSFHQKISNISLLQKTVIDGIRRKIIQS